MINLLYYIFILNNIFLHLQNKFNSNSLKSTTKLKTHTSTTQEMFNVTVPWNEAIAQ